MDAKTFQRMLLPLNVIFAGFCVERHGIPPLNEIRTIDVR